MVLADDYCQEVDDYMVARNAGCLGHPDDSASCGYDCFDFFAKYDIRLPDDYGRERPTACMLRPSTGVGGRNNNVHASPPPLLGCSRIFDSC